MIQFLYNESNKEHEMSEKHHEFGQSVPEPQYRELQKIGDRNERSVRFIVRQLISDYLRRNEREQDYILALASAKRDDS